MRKHKRYVLDLPVALEEAAGPVKRVFLLRTADVSAGGALFRAERGLPVGAEVRLTFFLRADPHGVKIDSHHRFCGRVVRSEPGQFAVAFGREVQAAGPAAMHESGASKAPLGASARPDGERG